MNLEIHRFKETIINVVNMSPLPIEVKRMALSEITMAVSDASKNALEEELKKFKEQQKNSEEENADGNSSKKR